MSTPNDPFTFLRALLGSQERLAPRKSKRRRSWEVLSESTKRRDIRAVRRARPDLSAYEAERTARRMRNRGYIPESVNPNTATGEQLENARRYQRRSEAAKKAAYTRTYERFRRTDAMISEGREPRRLLSVGVTVITYRENPVTKLVETISLLVPAQMFSPEQRTIASTHRNYVYAYLHSRHAWDYIPIIESFRGVQVIVRTSGTAIYDDGQVVNLSAGTFIDLEYDINRIDFWANAAERFTPSDKFYKDIVA